ncbi:ATP-binding cassette domain-containing protein [Hoeflea sp. WL0058]|uniref:ATP-binding cassette domain-containing protein n=1 Tax=Flavimaribacter sediminis TaxID=2865987 RepID=A0AAE2ZLW9_9HYPH|nr:ATP-binding cassette domain-containing protein [Flavimaribacter sediminis]MBW8635717.1 ATP-binding cassette domain-containing protein [Flavimaribacter sediminis]
MSAVDQTAPVFDVRNVSKTFVSGEHRVKALESVSLKVMRGQCLAVVGESGSGKSTLANLLLGIHQPTTGDLYLDGNLLPGHRTLPLRRMIQLVQQNPLSSLNPRRTVGASLRLALDVHDIGDRQGRKERVGALLEEVGLPADFASRYPAALSGGQRQRVAVARALACEPEIVVLDEPTSALDVLVQARVLRMLDELRRRRDLTYVFITHDLGVVRNIADRVAVFEKGRLVEESDTETIFTNPANPYTRRLISAIPIVSDEEETLRRSLMEETNDG